MSPHLRPPVYIRAPLMPRVLRILNRFNLGGPTHNAAYLTRYLAPEFETLLVGGPEEAHEEGSHHILRAVGVEPLVLPEMQRAVAFQRDRAAYLRIKQIIREFKPDIVHTHAAKAGAVGRLAAAHMGVKAIVHTFHGHVFHSYFGPTRTAVYKGIERYLARRTHRIVAISERQKYELVDIHRIAPAHRVTVIPLGFDLSRFEMDQVGKRSLFRTAHGLADTDLAVGIVGRLVPVKNHPLFLRTVAGAARETGLPLRAIVVGDGSERASLEALAVELGLALHRPPEPLPPGPSVTFAGWVEDMDVVYAGLDIVVMTSLNEGTPVSLIEAQAAGRPIVTTRVGGVENVVVPDGTAFLAASGDVDGLRAGLVRLVRDPALRAAMGAPGPAHVRERYHYQRLVNDMAALYRSLLA